MKISLVMASFKRPELLNFGLWSICQQNISYDLETIIINDGIKDDTENICNKYKEKLNIKYIFTGQRNSKDKSIFRSPTFSLNVGIKQSIGDIIILSCPEIFHLDNNSINKIINPFKNSKNILSTTECLCFDNDGAVLNYLLKNLTLNLPSDIMSSLETDTPRCKYGSTNPFCMGIYKQELIDIGGYDEDFTGWGADDDDLTGRLKLKGLQYNYCLTKIAHLYHPKSYNEKEKYKDEKYLKNLKLLRERKGKIIRNENREWGKNEQF